MRYLTRKILSFVLPIIILTLITHGLLYGFANIHICGIGLSAIILALIWCGKMIRKIIFFPINLLRKVLWRL